MKTRAAKSRSPTTIHRISGPGSRRREPGASARSSQPSAFLALPPKVGFVVQPQGVAPCSPAFLANRPPSQAHVCSPASSGLPPSSFSKLNNIFDQGTTSESSGTCWISCSSWTCRRRGQFGCCSALTSCLSDTRCFRDSVNSVRD